MARIFDRDTLLDLTVNVIPLGIILFFVVAFLVFDPFSGLDGLGRVLQMGLLAFPFVALALLTYVSGKAIAGDEKRASVFFQGQATMEGAQTKHEAEEAMHGDVEAETEADAETESEAGADAAEATADEAEDADESAANADDDEE